MLRVRGLRHVGSFYGLLNEWQAGAPVRSAPLPGNFITEPRYAGDDQTLTVYRFDNVYTYCQEAVLDLRPSSLGNLIGNPISVAQSLCISGRTVQPNLRRPPLIAGTVASNGRSLARLPRPSLKARLRTRVN